MFLKGLKVEQLELLLVNLSKKIEKKPYTSKGYFDMKRQVGEIEHEIKVRQNLVRTRSLLIDF